MQISVSIEIILIIIHIKGGGIAFGLEQRRLENSITDDLPNTHPLI